MQMWQALKTCYAALDPDAAENILLDNTSGITGTRRRSASYSQLQAVNISLNSGTTLNPGATISVSGNPASVWVFQGPAITAGSTAVYTGLFYSQTPGPQVGNAGTVTVINSPVPGWTAVTNPTDAIQGIVQDTDTTLRQRRLANLVATSTSPLEGQRAAILAVGGGSVIDNCTVTENTSNTTTGPTAPPHSTHATLWSNSVSQPSNNSPLANEIAQAIWSKMAGGGIPSEGSIVRNSDGSHYEYDLCRTI